MNCVLRKLVKSVTLKIKFEFFISFLITLYLFTSALLVTTRFSPHVHG